MQKRAKGENGNALLNLSTDSMFKMVSSLAFLTMSLSNAAMMTDFHEKVDQFIFQDPSLSIAEKL